MPTEETASMEQRLLERCKELTTELITYKDVWGKRLAELNKDKVKLEQRIAELEPAIKRADKEIGVLVSENKMLKELIEERDEYE